MAIKTSVVKESLTLWLGSLDAHAELLKQDDWLASATAEDLAALGPEMYAGSDDDEFGDFGYMVSRHEDSAIIEIRGKLVPGNSWYNRYMGRTGYGEIQEAFASVAEANGINRAIMRVASNGGSTDGVDEAGTFIRNFDKKVMPVYAHTSSSQHSAAMWIASGARKRAATEMASVGSVGVIAIFMEYTEMMKQQGIKAHVFREGKNKALVNPYEKLSKKAEAYVKLQMSQLNTFFVQALSTNLGLTEAYVRDKIADGSEFFGAEAKTLGLITKVMTFDAMLEELGKASSAHTQVYNTGAQAMSLKNKGKDEAILTPGAQAAASAGAPLEAALEAHPEDAEESLETQATEGEEQTALETEAESAEAGSASEPAKPVEASAQGGMEIMIDKLAASQQEGARLKVEVEQLASALAAAEAGSAALVAIATEWGKRMQIGLGGTATLNAESMAPGVLAAEVSRIKETFDSKFVPGQKVESASESEADSDHGGVTSISKSRANAASFKKD